MTARAYCVVRKLKKVIEKLIKSHSIMINEIYSDIF